MEDYKGTQTEKNLQTAYTGEVTASVKYHLYAEKAMEEGYGQIHDIFEETARNEQEHAKLWFSAMHGGSVPTTADNLADSVAVEHYEYSDMYLGFSKTAYDEGFKALGFRFEEVSKIEKHHMERFQKLLDNVKQGKVFQKDDVVVWKCEICGHLHIGKEAPKICPVCGKPQAYFELSADNY